MFSLLFYIPERQHNSCMLKCIYHSCRFVSYHFKRVFNTTLDPSTTKLSSYISIRHPSCTMRGDMYIERTSEIVIKYVAILHSDFCVLEERKTKNLISLILRISVLRFPFFADKCKQVKAIQTEIRSRFITRPVHVWKRRDRSTGWANIIAICVNRLKTGLNNCWENFWENFLKKHKFTPNENKPNTTGILKRENRFLL